MRPSGGPEKAPPLRVPLRVALRTPWLVASPSQPQPHLLLASCSSVLPRGPGTFPSPRGYFLGETSSSAARLGVRPPLLVGLPHGSWGSAALGARAGCPAIPGPALLARGRGCSVNVSLIVWSRLRRVTESGCAESGSWPG